MPRFLSRGVLGIEPRALGVLTPGHSSSLLLCGCDTISLRAGLFRVLLCALTSSTDGVMLYVMAASSSVLVIKTATF